MNCSQTILQKDSPVKVSLYIRAIVSLFATKPGQSLAALSTYKDLLIHCEGTVKEGQVLRESKKEGATPMQSAITYIVTRWHIHKIITQYVYRDHVLSERGIVRNLGSLLSYHVFFLQPWTMEKEKDCKSHAPNYFCVHLILFIEAKGFCYVYPCISYMISRKAIICNEDPRL